MSRSLELERGRQTLNVAAQVASCEALNGFPKPNITWYRNNAPLLSTPGRECRRRPVCDAVSLASVAIAKLTLSLHCFCRLLKISCVIKLLLINKLLKQQQAVSHHVTPLF